MVSIIDDLRRINYSKLTRLRMDIRVFVFWIKIPDFLIKEVERQPIVL